MQDDKNGIANELAAAVGSLDLMAFEENTTLAGTVARVVTAAEAAIIALRSAPSAERHNVLTERQKWQAGIDAARTYLAGSTFGERESPTVNACLALLKSLRENPLWGPSDAHSAIPLTQTEEPK